MLNLGEHPVMVFSTQRLQVFLSIRWIVSYSSAAITVRIDDRFDTAGFFFNPLAHKSLQTEINNIASRLLDTLEPITPGPSGFRFDNVFNVVINNPSTGRSTTLSNFSIPRDTLVVFIGARDIPGSTIGFGGRGARAPRDLQRFP